MRGKDWPVNQRMTLSTELNVTDLMAELSQQLQALNQKIEGLEHKVDTRFECLEKRIIALGKQFNVCMSKTDEKLNSIDQTVMALREQNKQLDNQLWVMVSGLFLALFGSIAKGWLFLGYPWSAFLNKLCSSSTACSR
jgi:predicted  nucleic acid-binding Zn-ribbon protein